MSAPVDKKSPQGPPPHYVAHNAAGQPLYAESSAVYVTHGYEPHRGSCTSRRFIRAFLVAGGVWILLTMFAHSVAQLAYHRHGWFGQSEYPVPGDVNLDRCVSAGDWVDVERPRRYPDLPPVEGHLDDRFPFKSQYSFDVPLTPDVHWFMSKGRWSGGSLNIVTAPEQAKDKITYHVVVHYYRDWARDRAQVCTISREDANEHGVGIFTPTYRYDRDNRERRLWFETTVVLPTTENGSPLLIKKFASDATNTVHRTSQLAEKVHFDTIDLQSSNAPMSFASLSADYGNIKSSNGPIHGIFNTTHSLVLSTSNASIKTAVGITSTKDAPEPQVVLRTSNGPIESQFSLFNSEDAPGAYHIETTTSNSPLNIVFATAPVDSTLYYNGRTSNSPATVALHPTYEGSFFAQTSSIFRAEVRVNPNVEDPSGKDRVRYVQDSTSRSSTSGHVVWGDHKKDDVKGQVELRTSNSPAVLHL